MDATTTKDGIEQWVHAAMDKDYEKCSNFSNGEEHVRSVFAFAAHAGGGTRLIPKLAAVAAPKEERDEIALLMAWLSSRRGMPSPGYPHHEVASKFMACVATWEAR